MRKRDAIVLVLLCGFVVLCAGAGRMHSKLLMCTTNLKKMSQALKVYCDTYDGTMPAMDSVTYIRAYWMLSSWNYTTNKQDWANAGCFFKAGLIPDGRTFYCPATPGYMDEYLAYSNPAPWGSNLQLQAPNQSGTGNAWLRAVKGYIYWPQSKRLATASDLATMGSSVSLRYQVGYPMPTYTISELDPARAMVVDSVALTDETGMYKTNALFGDGHVRYQTTPRNSSTGKWYYPYQGQFPNGLTAAQCTEIIMCQYMYQFQP